MRATRFLVLLAFVACDDGSDGGNTGDPRSGDVGGRDGSPAIDFEVERPDGAVDAANVEPDAAPECEDGVRRCGENGVEICNDGAWAEFAECPGGTVCVSGECTPELCDPECGDAECGPDGCGGVCGECGDGAVCDTGECVVDDEPRCGDDACNGDENCETCPADCGGCCGNEECGADENCATCPADCACPDGESCDAMTQACEACAPQCEGRECGSDGCGGECGDCGDGVACDRGLCDACRPDCGDRACGPDGCGGDCGACDNDLVCGLDGQCAERPAACGDDECGAGEDCANCPADCGNCCGDGACEPAADESCATCPADCGCEGGEMCNAERRECVDVCQPQCDGRNCGDNGCGGVCGLCADNQACIEGVCRDQCMPMCAGRQCGGDGCGGRCGECEGDDICDDGRCVEQCVPNCAGRVCGDDGCGGECGVCPAGDCTDDGQCVEECVPDCGGKFCGPNGCGQVCGDCADDQQCTPQGQCEGGDDPCDCVGDDVCLDGRCRAPEALCSAENPVGICRSGQDCLAGECVNRGAACSPQNPTGVCPLGEICRDGACEGFDGEALCDDDNACTGDVFDQRANRCENRPVVGECDDGNGCTANRCEDGVCLADPVPGCIEPPTIDPYVSPTNGGVLNLAGTKPAGSSIRIDGADAIPESPDERWEVVINLQPGENVLRVRSVDMGEQSAEVVVRVVYDIDPPTVRASPSGGVFLNPVGVTVVASEPATVYYTEDGATPQRWSKSFRSAKQFRVFHDVQLKFRALDDAGNWSEEVATMDFEITGYGTQWRPAPALPEGRTLATAELLDGEIVLVGGTDGLAAQAGVDVYDITSEEWAVGPALEIARAQLASTRSGDRVYIVGGESDGLPLNLIQRLSAAGDGVGEPGTDAEHPLWSQRRVSRRQHLRLWRQDQRGRRA